MLDVFQTDIMEEVLGDQSEDRQWVIKDLEITLVKAPGWSG